MIKQNGGGSDGFNGNWSFAAGSALEIIDPREATRTIADAEIPGNIRDDFNEAAAVLPVSPKASGALSRRLLQHILREHFKIQRRLLSEEIADFLTKTDIPDGLGESVDAIRHVGNFGAHPLKDTNTGEVIEVKEHEAEWLLDALESLFDYAYIQPERAKARKAKLNVKLKAAGKKEMK